ncbi:hypothetical protein GIS00_23200 [Nakamurella sp. YIM 132087]|uniref:Uncharacterized protein n=1 Tax=Nakamurella alba TaxID=2665158 RepID=A0A7K1FRS9_9ACTN|nr:hypothetical protein [Nakamurella alba]MTD16845.1 hypothetical protein [Nakamurella alba]
MTAVPSSVPPDDTQLEEHDLAAVTGGFVGMPTFDRGGKDPNIGLHIKRTGPRVIHYIVDET